MIGMMRAVPLRRIKVGDTISLPGRDGVRPMRVTEHDVNDGRLLLLPQGLALPCILIKSNGRWRVDPEPFIIGRTAGRQGADRDRRGTESAGPDL